MDWVSRGRSSPGLNYNFTLYRVARTIQLDVVFGQGSILDRHGTGMESAGAARRVPSRLMSETTGELPGDWWTTEDVLAFLRSVGAPISRATWAAYVSRGQAPAPDRMFGRSPAWRPAAVRDWQASRPRRGSIEA
jgi:hypothetical protein